MLDQQVQRKVEDIQRWRERAVIISPGYTGMPGSRDGDKVQSAVEMIDQLSRESSREVSAALAVRREIESIIRGVEDRTLCLLLEYRYIDGLTWKEISEKMGYEERWVFRLHGRALDTLKINKPC